MMQTSQHKPLLATAPKRHVEVLVEAQVRLRPLGRAMEFLVETHHPKPGEMGRRHDGCKRNQLLQESRTGKSLKIMEMCSMLCPTNRNDAQSYAKIYSVHLSVPNLPYFSSLFLRAQKQLTQCRCSQHPPRHVSSESTKVCATPPQLSTPRPVTGFS